VNQSWNYVNQLTVGNRPVGGYGGDFAVKNTNDFEILSAEKNINKMIKE